MSIYDKASLVLIPSGTKTSKVYSQKPVSGDGDFTFSRSTGATRINADGNIEKETQNLLLQSNSFDTTWTKSDVDLTANQSGYDGSNDAWKLQKTSTNTYRYVAQIISASGVQTASFYVKAGTLTQVGILVSGGDNPYVSYNLSTGTIIAQRASVIDSSITDVGGGWYRCTMTYNVTISDINIYPDWNQTNTGNLYIQDAQLEQGMVARDVIETTTAAVEGGITDNVPRLDYTDSSCPALLLEPQRTNIFTQSEHFDGNDWTSYGGVVLTSNNAVSPEGVQNATKMSEAGGIYDQIAYTADTNYSFSLFVKSDTATHATMNYVDQAAGYLGGTITYTFATGGVAVTGQSANASVTADKEDYGNGWIRVIMNFKTNVSQNYNYQQISFGGGDGWIYGAQLEAGSYATSYIPTYGTSVTRNADSYYNNNMASLYDSANGFCLYFEYADVKRGGTAFFDYFSFQQLPNTDTGFRAEAAGANNLEWRVYVDNIDTDLGFPMRVSNIESKRKVLLKVETTGIKLFADGSIEDSQSGYVVIPTLGTLQPLRSTAQPAITQIKQSLGQILYLPVLSDAECLALTTI